MSVSRSSVSASSVSQAAFLSPSPEAYDVPSASADALGSEVSFPLPSAVSPTLSLIPSELHQKILEYLNPSAVAAMTLVDKSCELEATPHLLPLFRKTFGDIISPIQSSNREILGRLFSYAEQQPDVKVNHSLFQAPSGILERWKWMLGFENRLDHQVQETYDSHIALLENMKPTTILQLKNLMVAFWHTDRQVRDYKQMKMNARMEATSTRLGRIFFKVIECLMKCFWNPASSLYIKQSLESRSHETFVKIGEFKEAGQAYDVVAFHPVTAGNRGGWSREVNREGQFLSLTYGKTYVGIFSREQRPSLAALGHHGTTQNFKVTIGRDQANAHYNSIVSEENSGLGDTKVLKDGRYLLVNNDLEYRGGRYRNPRGSDRVLDQRLTQIMVEMAMQNKDILSLDVYSNHDDLPVLTAGGFRSHASSRMLDQLQQFRSHPDNALFPPYRDYSCVSTRFRTESYKERQVRYSRDEVKSWDEIICAKGGGTLYPEAAVLPEYWAKAPNLAQEPVEAE